MLNTIIGTVLVTSLPILGILIGAALQYIFGRRLEAGKLLINQKAMAYTDDFKAAAGLGQGQTQELLALATDAKARICLFGSREAVHKLSVFEQQGAVGSTPEGRGALIALTTAMREDLLGIKRHVEPRELDFVLFGRDHH